MKVVGYSMHRLLLYYPNTQCPHFNWFLCGKKYHREGKDLWEISPSTTFYEPSTGKSWGVKVREGILLPFHQDRGGWVEEDSTPTLRNRLVCERYIFHLPSSSLTPIKGDTCRMVLFSQRYSPEIQELIPSFPSPSEIGTLLKRDGCATTCLRLYPLLQKFFTLEKF